MDRSLKPTGASGKHAMDSGGGGSKELKMVLSQMLGVRDGPGRNATKAEMLDVSKHLYIYLVKNYLEGDAKGKWGKWDEETHFPRHEFQSNSSRDNAGVFDGFDVNEFADQYLINGRNKHLSTKCLAILPTSLRAVLCFHPHEVAHTD